MKQLLLLCMLCALVCSVNASADRSEKSVGKDLDGLELLLLRLLRGGSTQLTSETALGLQSRQQTGDPCDGGAQYTGTEGQVQTPGYPANYGNLIECTWSITVPEDQTITLTFNEPFNIEGNSRNCYDLLTVYDGRTGVGTKRYCGTTTPAPYTTTGNVLELHFASGRGGSRAGFSATFKANGNAVIGGGIGGGIEIPELSRPASDNSVKVYDSMISRPIKSCGQPAIAPSVGRVVGGRPAVAHSWPWQVSIRIRKGRKIESCGGSIINENWIVTAAHCTEGASQASQISITVGGHDLRNKDQYQQAMQTAEFIQHPDYSGAHGSPQYNNDICLLRTKEPIEFNDAVSPICLPSEPSSAYEECALTGWGKTQGDARGGVAVLQQAKIPIISRSDCLSSAHEPIKN